MRSGVNERMNEIKPDLARALHEPHFRKLLSDISELRRKLNHAEITMRSFKNQLATIESADRFYTRSSRSASWYEEAEFYDIDNSMVPFIKRACRKAVANHGKSIKKLQYNLDKLLFELYSHIYMNLRLMGHSTSTTTKIAVHRLLDNGSY